MEIIGDSVRIKTTIKIAEMAAKSDAAILLTGETGTGKDVFAKYIHNKSSRSQNPFIVINCALFQETLINTELFGHVKGAFTGATYNYKGKFITADQGTLFLDEIGEMSLDMQAKLLRVLEDKIIYPVGSEESIKVDVRIIAATNRNLQESVRKGTFREDLYYRLNIIKITLPPLRERTGDVPLLVHHFSKGFLVFEPDAIKLLQNQLWAGNVRELKNCIDTMIALTDKKMITCKDLSEKLVETTEETPRFFEILRNLGVIPSEYRRFLIESELKKNSGRIRTAASNLALFNISRQSIRTFKARRVG